MLTEKSLGALGDVMLQWSRFCRGKELSYRIMGESAKPTSATRTDPAQWVQRARAGDADVWSEIDSRIRDSVVARLRLPASVDREEVAAETTADVWKALRTLRDEQKLLSFAATVARRVASRKRREQSRHLPLEAEPESSTPQDGIGESLDRRELIGKLESSLASADRQLFQLLYVLGKSSAELQAELGVSGRLLRQRKHRLHNKLRRALPRGHDDS